MLIRKNVECVIAFKKLDPVEIDVLAKTCS